jgi:hypothetical protein
MTPDEKGINLLPQDRRTVRNKSKKTSKNSSALGVDYTDPNDTEIGFIPKEKKQGFLGRIFGKNKGDKKVEQKKDDKEIQKKVRDLPVGKPLSSALFASSNQLTQNPTEDNNAKPSQIKPIKVPSKIPVEEKEKNLSKNKVETNKEKKETFFSKIFSIFSKKKTEENKPKDISQTQDIASEMFEKTTRVPKRKISIEYVPAKLNGTTQGINAGRVQSLHNPDFLNSKPVDTIESEIDKSKKEKELKRSFFSKIFSRKSKIDSKEKENIKEKKEEKVLNTVKVVPVATRPEGTKKEGSITKSADLVSGANNNPEKKKKTGLFRKISRAIFSRKKIVEKVGDNKGTEFLDKTTQEKSKIKLEENKVTQEKQDTPITKQPETPITIDAKEVAKNKDAKTSLANNIAKKGLKGLTQAPIHKKDLHDVNLLSAEYSQRFSKGNPKMAIITSVVAVVLVIVFGWVALHLYGIKGKSKTDEVVVINDALRQTISTYSAIEKEDKDLARRIKTISKLLDNHIAWKSFLQRLEESTIPEVTYVSMGASTKGSIGISALAKDYTSMARQITVFETDADWIEEVFVTSASLAEDKTGKVNGVAFDVLVVINNNALQYIE